MAWTIARRYLISAEEASEIRCMEHEAELMREVDEDEKYREMYGGFDNLN